MEIVKTLRFSFTRQLHESVTVAEPGTVLNNRCLVPTLEVKGSSKESRAKQAAREERRQTQQLDIEAGSSNTKQMQQKRTIITEPSREAGKKNLHRIEASGTGGSPSLNKQKQYRRGPPATGSSP